ncbi:MAG TPA: hypothetical protein VLL97_11275 [Acidobacteriota bacterium]|nr:hypothetical protein [Acidobacteriota bacterium]
MKAFIKTGLLWMVIAVTPPVQAQQVISARAGMISHTEGQVCVGAPIRCDGNNWCELENGQRLQSGDGMAEMQLGPFASLWMGENGTLLMENNALSDTRVLIEEGSVFLEIMDAAIDQNISLRFRDAVITFRGAGLYRLDSEASLFRVYDGRADVVRGSQKESPRQGRAVTITDTLNVSRFAVGEEDAFHAWVSGRSDVLYAKIRTMRIMDVKKRNAEMLRMLNEAAAKAWEMERRRQMAGE